MCCVMASASLKSWDLKIFIYFFNKHPPHPCQWVYLPLHLYGLERYHVCAPLISAEWCEMASRQADNPLWGKSVCHYTGSQLFSVCVLLCCRPGNACLCESLCIHVYVRTIAFSYTQQSSSACYNHWHSMTKQSLLKQLVYTSTTISLWD